MASINDTLLKDIAFKSDFIKTATGDLDTVEGLANLKEALFRRLITVKGSLIHRPDYGVGIKLFQNGINNFENRRKIAGLIEEQFLQDTRVEKVLGVSIENNNSNPDLTKISVRVKVVGYGETGFDFIPFGGDI